MPPHRRYDTTTKARAVGIALVKGVTQTERETHIPKNTVQYWLTRPEFVQLRTTAREDVTEQMWAAAQEALVSMVEAMHDAPLRDRAQAFDTIMEHFALMTGQATSRTETKDLTNKMSDHERELLSAAIDEWLATTDAVPG